MYDDVIGNDGSDRSLAAVSIEDEEQDLFEPLHFRTGYEPNHGSVPVVEDDFEPIGIHRAPVFPDNLDALLAGAIATSESNNKDDSIFQGFAI